MARQLFHYLYTPMKATEGGTAQSWWRTAARTLGLRVQFGPSALVGHYDVFVNTNDRRKRGRLLRAMGYE